LPALLKDGVGINKKNMKLSTYDVLINRAGADSVITPTVYENLSIMPANILTKSIPLSICNTGIIFRLHSEYEQNGMSVKNMKDI